MRIVEFNSGKFAIRVTNNWWDLKFGTVEYLDKFDDCTWVTPETVKTFCMFNTYEEAHYRLVNYTDSLKVKKVY